MSRIRLLRTTTFRTALAYACLYSLLSAAAMVFIYWSTASYIEAQVDERLRLETNVLLARYQSQALPALTEAIRQRSREDGPRSLFFYLLLGLDQEPLAGHFTRWPGGLEQDFATLRFDQLFPRAPPGLSGTDPVRVLATPLPGGYRLLVGRDLNEQHRLLEHTLVLAGSVTVATFLLALGGSLWLGSRTLRRIDAVSRTAHEIMAGDLSRRLPVTDRDDEFDQLGRELNAMLERIEQLMAGLRQVSDNIAHDLRSPLSRLRNRLEITLLEARHESAYRTELEQAIRDADELLKTFAALLSIAQAEAGVSREPLAPVELAGLVEDMADLYGAAAEEQGIEFHWQVQAVPPVAGNRRLLAQALANLLDNAVKYTPPGGAIALTLGMRDSRVELSVADTGPGIPEADRERVLERFVRLDSARSTAGSGLGLSLVRAVARLHQAELRLEDNYPGLRVVLSFASAH